MSKFKVELPNIENINGKEVTELEFREPFGADMEDVVGGISAAGGDKKAMGKVITQLAEQLVVSHQVTQDEFRAMSGKSYMAIVGALSGFLA